jgi:hypothetical protein
MATRVSAAVDLVERARRRCQYKTAKLCVGVWAGKYAEEDADRDCGDIMVGTRSSVSAALCLLRSASFFLRALIASTTRTTNAISRITPSPTIVGVVWSAFDVLERSTVVGDGTEVASESAGVSV